MQPSTSIGQTPGKRAARLRVVMADGSPLSRRAASARSVRVLERVRVP